MTIERCRGEDDAWFCIGQELREEIERLRAALRALVDQTPGSHPLYQASLDALLGDDTTA